MRCVFDTNVLISALLLPDSKPRQALNRALHEGTVLLSIALLSELRDVLATQRFSRYVDEEDVRRFVAALIRDAELFQVHVTISACRDRKDDKFLELAVSGNASHLVTGDSDLLVLNPFQGVRIVSPRSFLELSEAQP